MQQFHDDTFKTFPRRVSDIHPNINVTEEFEHYGPTRGEWILIAIVSGPTIAVLVGLIFWFIS